MNYSKTLEELQQETIVELEDRVLELERKLEEHKHEKNLELARVGAERDRVRIENEKLKARLYHVKKGFVEVLTAVD